MNKSLHTPSLMSQQVNPPHHYQPNLEIRPCLLHLGDLVLNPPDLQPRRGPCSAADVEIQQEQAGCSQELSQELWMLAHGSADTCHAPPVTSQVNGQFPYPC
eukprot:324913-Hanusia_phi.AAC.1